MQYEMRTYLVPQGRMDDILARFRDVTMGLFKKYDMECLGFWTITKPEEDYALVYLMRYESPEAQEKSWDAFRADPEWLATRERTEANGPIVEEIVSKDMHPVDFSPMQ